MYTRPDCKFCKQIKKFYKTNKWEFEEKILGVHFKRLDFENMFGKTATFPRVFINNKLIGGCDETISFITKEKTKK